MSESAGQSEAARRAAARKAKILARGNTGLQKLAQTARGDEAETLYGGDAGPSTFSTPAAQTPSKEVPNGSGGPSWVPPQPTGATRPTGPSVRPQQAQMTAEQQQMAEQLSAMFGGANPFGGAGGEGGMPDMSRLLAQMMGGMDPSAGAGGQNLLGDLDDSAGLGGQPGPNANPFAGLGGLGGMGGMGGMGDGGGLPPNLFGEGGFPGFPGMPGMGGAAQKTKVAKYFPIAHVVAMVLLAVFSVTWWEPALRATRWGHLLDSGGIAGRWHGLAGGRGVIRLIKNDVLGMIEPIAIFWAFSTVELILQTTRFMIFKSPPPPHSLISNFLPLMPPKIAKPLVTGSRYLNLLVQTYKDGAMLVFLLGLTTIYAQWAHTPLVS